MSDLYFVESFVRGLVHSRRVLHLISLLLTVVENRMFHLRELEQKRHFDILSIIFSELLVIDLKAFVRGGRVSINASLVDQPRALWFDSVSAGRQAAWLGPGSLNLMNRRCCVRFAISPEPAPAFLAMRTPHSSLELPTQREILGIGSGYRQGRNDLETGGCILPFGYFDAFGKSSSSSKV